MISVKLEGHNFRYQVEEIIKLFFEKEEVVFVESQPLDDYRGIFVLSSLLRKENSCTLRNRIVIAGRNYIHGPAVIPCGQQCDEHEIRKLFKREVKRQLYLILSRFTRKMLPWGILTGIRPTKIVHEGIESGRAREEIVSNLTDYYRVSREKARMLYDIAGVESSILDRTDSRMVGLYIGIPFCTTRCLYCSFTSDPINKCSHLVGKYIESLKAEIKGTMEILEARGNKVQSIYIGGGTPTSIDAASIRELLEFIEKNIDLSQLEEYTLEAGRPDSIDDEKLQIIKNSRVSRISINPQTMNDDTLRLIGRSHSSRDIIDAFKKARKFGLGNINMDIIAGLPGESSSMFEYTLQKICELEPESITVHTMAIKRASRLSEDKEKFPLTPEEEVNEMISFSRQYADNMGMHPYYLYRQKNILGNLENVGYCKPGFESIYNIQIMEEKQSIIAFGAGAATKIVFPEENRLERAFNVKNVEEYINRVDEMVERKRALLE